MTEVCPNQQSSNGYQRLWVGEKSRAGENCFVNRFTFDNIWLCLITLQIYSRGDNMLMLMILCEEKPRLWTDQGSEEALWSEAETVRSGSVHWQELWLFALIFQLSGLGQRGKGWGPWPFLDNFMMNTERRWLIDNGAEGHWRKTWLPPGENYWYVEVTKPPRSQEMKTTCWKARLEY